MTPELFARIAGHVFPYAKTVTYSCDAEPFTNPHFEELIRLGRIHKVPLTSVITNAHLMTPRISEGIVNQQISQINVSIDACTDRTYRIIRRSDQFHVVIENVKTLVEIKERACSEKPKIFLAFVMMRSNIDELPGFVEMARSLKAQGVCGFHAAIFKGRGMRDETLNKHKELTNEMLLSARKIAEASDLEFSFPPPFTIGGIKHIQVHNPSTQCNTVYDILFIAADGRVYPCPWLNEDPFWGQLGNAASQNLRKIWFSERFAELRRNLKNNQLSPTCQICPQLGGIGTVDDDMTFQEI